MLKILGEHYYLDLDRIEKYISVPGETGVTENHISVMKYEMVKFMTEVLLSEKEDIDEALGNKSNISIPFKIAFNTLLNKELLNKY
jgi:hypothetical protein